MTKQDYGTPLDFLDRVEDRYGKITFDLAANDDGSNAVAPFWYGPDADSLSRDWRSMSGTLWLNPPFKRAEPWALKCASTLAYDCAFDRIVMLTLMSLGSNWAYNHVIGKASIVLLRPRIVFIGEKNPFPKDLMLSIYEPKVEPVIATWDWKRDLFEEWY